MEGSPKYYAEPKKKTKNKKPEPWNMRSLKLKTYKTILYYLIIHMYVVKISLRMIKY